MNIWISLLFAPILIGIISMVLARRPYRNSELKRSLEENSTPKQVAQILMLYSATLAITAALYGIALVLGIIKL
jgi:hypothetical protein